MTHKNWLFNIFISSLCTAFVAFSTLFGYSLNSTREESRLLSASYFEDNQYYTHTEISDNNLSYDNFLKISHSLYGQKKKINSYVVMNEPLSIEYGEVNYHLKVCTVPVFSDKEEMECIAMPLYLDNSSIGTGPINNAKYAAYISSSFADALIERKMFVSFDDILNSTFVFKFTDEITFSINNIYLNNNSIYWNDKDDFNNNSFYNHFSSWNSDTIFAYCPALFRSSSGTTFCADVRNGYGNLALLMKSIRANINDNVTLVIHKNNKNNSFTIICNPFENESISFKGSQILFIVLSLCSLFLLVFLAFKYVYMYSTKLFFLFSCISILILLFSELLKSLLKTNFIVYVIFNKFLNISLLLIILLTIVIFIFSRKKQINESCSKFFSISI